MTAKHTVKLTANFERNLEELEAFLVEAGAPHAFDALLDELIVDQRETWVREMLRSTASE